MGLVLSVSKSRDSREGGGGIIQANFKMAWKEEFLIVLKESYMHFGKSTVFICLLIMPEI